MTGTGTVQVGVLRAGERLTTGRDVPPGHVALELTDAEGAHALVTRPTVMRRLLRRALAELDDGGD